MNVSIFQKYFNIDALKEVRTEKFDKIHKLMKNWNNEKYRKYLIFFYDLLMNSINVHDDELNFLNISLPNLIDDNEIDIILEFIALSFFFIGIEQIANENVNETDSRTLYDMYLKDKELINKPPFLKRKDPRSKRKEIENQKKRQRKYLNELNNTFNGLEDSPLLYQSYFPKTLLNLFKYDQEKLDRIFNERYFVIKPEDLINRDNLYLQKRSLVLSNYNLNLSQLSERRFRIGQPIHLLKSLRNIIIFKDKFNHIGRHSSINKDYLEELNNKSGCNFKNLIVISFSTESFSLSKMVENRQKIIRNYTNNLESANNGYLRICEHEFGKIFEKNHKIIEPQFVNFNDLAYQQIINFIKNHPELKELISMRLRNIYSLCYNHTIKNYLIKQIFESTQKSLLHEETYEAISTLTNHDIFELKKLLEQLLFKIIELNLPHKIRSHSYSNYQNYIISKTVLKDSSFLEEISKDLKISKFRFMSWSDLNNGDKNLFILDYRDSGNVPFFIYPNILQLRVSYFHKVNTLFLSPFFYNQFIVIRRKFLRKYYKEFLETNNKNKYYDFDKIRSEIFHQFEIDEDDALFDENDEFTSHHEHNYIHIRYENNSGRKFLPSELFVIKTGEDEKFQISTLQEIKELYEEDKSQKLIVQRVSKLYEGLDLFKFTQEEEKELEKLKKKYDLNENEREHRLWKVLLNRKCKYSNAEKIHKELSETLSGIDSKMVGFNYFCDHWLNLDSPELCPRNKQVFKGLVKYFELDNFYYRMVLKKRAREKMATQSNNAKMDSLVSELIDFITGFKDIDNINNDLYEEINNSVDLESIAITKDIFVDEIKALIDLLRENFQPKKIIEVRQE